MHILILIFLDLFFLLLGLLALKWVPLISFLSGIFLILLGSYAAMDYSITLNYHYVNSSAIWISNTIDMPYSPYPQMLMILCGIILMIGFSVEISGE